MKFLAPKVLGYIAVHLHGRKDASTLLNDAKVQQHWLLLTLARQESRARPLIKILKVD
jgi:hypothetical protein